MIEQARLYDVDGHVAELYDALETGTEDLALIRRLVAGVGPLRIVEPFCGTGRLLLPLAQDGHAVVGLDSSKGMLARARQKAAACGGNVQARVTLIEMDVLHADWPSHADLVLLGGNCFYELATAEDQRACIRAAYNSLEPGGRIYVDNDHMEGMLEASWQDMTEHRCFPAGTCADGTTLESTMRTIWFDAESRLVRFERKTTVRTPDGRVWSTTCIQQKHPVSMGEVRDWLAEAGFAILAIYGDRSGTPYAPHLGRAVFWASRGR